MAAPNKRAPRLVGLRARAALWEVVFMICSHEASTLLWINHSRSRRAQLTPSGMCCLFARLALGSLCFPTAPLLCLRLRDERSTLSRSPPAPNYPSRAPMPAHACHCELCEHSLGSPSEAELRPRAAAWPPCRGHGGTAAGEPASGSAQPSPTDVTKGVSAMRQHCGSEPPVTALKRSRNRRNRRSPVSPPGLRVSA